MWGRYRITLGKRLSPRCSWKKRFDIPDQLKIQEAPHEWGMLYHEALRWLRSWSLYIDDQYVRSVCTDETTMGIIMLILSSIFFLSLLLEFGGCSRLPNQTHHRRFRRGGNNAFVDQTSPNSLRPFFKTNVYSTDGSSSNSKTPNIQTKVYIPQTPNSNLTNRGIMGERPITDCLSPTATFHYSHCSYRNDPTAPIRKYVVHCREADQPGSPPPTYTLPSEVGAMASDIARFNSGLHHAMHDSSLHAETGWCEAGEVCVTAWQSMGLGRPLTLTANCVLKKMFRDLGGWNNGWDAMDVQNEEEDRKAQLEEDDGGSATTGDSGGSVGGSSSSGLEVSDDAGSNHGTGQKQQQAQLGLANSIFAGKVASIVLSKDETGDSALQVEELELKSWGVDGTSSPLGGGVSSPSIDSKTGSVSGPGTKAPNALEILEQERNCTDCVSLKTFKPLAPDTEALEMEVKMVGAGSAALAGVLWVALLSG